MIKKTSLDYVANAMFHEPANGYSMVSSVAMFICNLNDVFAESHALGNLRFLKAEDNAQLNGLAPIKTADTTAKSGLSVTKHNSVNWCRCIRQNQDPKLTSFRCPLEPVFARASPDIKSVRLSISLSAIVETVSKGHIYPAWMTGQRCTECIDTIVDLITQIDYEELRIDSHILGPFPPNMHGRLSTSLVE